MKYKHTVSVVETVVRHYDVELEGGSWTNRQAAIDAALCMHLSGATTSHEGDQHVSTSWVCAQRISDSPEISREYKKGDRVIVHDPDYGNRPGTITDDTGSSYSVDGPPIDGVRIFQWSIPKSKAESYFSPAKNAGG